MQIFTVQSLGTNKLNRHEQVKTNESLGTNVINHQSLTQEHLQDNINEEDPVRVTFLILNYLYSFEMF